MVGSNGVNETNRKSPRFDVLRYSDAKALEAAKHLAEWLQDSDERWPCLRDDLADFIREHQDSSIRPQDIPAKNWLPPVVTKYLLHCEPCDVDVETDYPLENCPKCGQPVTD